MAGPAVGRSRTGRPGEIPIARVPTLSDVPFPVHMEPNLVVEFYSR
jgi:hypothetical protein